MEIYERPEIHLVGGDGKPSHLGAIIRFKAIRVADLTGNSLEQVLAGYEEGRTVVASPFSVLEIVKAGSERAKELAARPK